MTNMVAILSIILVLFLFIDEKKLKTKEQIVNNFIDKNKEYMSKLKYIQNDIINLEFSNIQELKENLNSIQEKYIFISKNNINITDEFKEKIIYNLSLNDDQVMLIKGKYSIQKEGSNLCVKYTNEFLIDTLNYMNIFDKESINNYYIIIGKTVNVQKYIYGEKTTKTICSEADKLYINLKDSQEIFDKCRQNVKNINIKTIIKIGIFVFTTGSITWNFIRSLVLLDQDIYMFLIATAIYYCYTKVVERMYITIGKMKYIASYIFPIYLIIYICTYLYIIIYSKKNHRYILVIFCEDKRIYYCIFNFNISVYCFFVSLPYIKERSARSSFNKYI